MMLRKNLGSVLVYAIYNTPTQAGPVHADTGDRSHYEAITGDSADEDKTVWDSYYRDKGKATNQDPVGFLKEQIQNIPIGRAFVPAMGEGRNAIFLAQKGFTVDGNDISDVAVDKVLSQAKMLHLNLKASVADVNQAQLPDGYYDLIVVSFYYSKNLVAKLTKSLKKGGYILFYNRVAETGAHKKMTSPDDFLVVPQELKAQLKDLHMEVFKEYVDQGLKVVGALAKKL